MADADADVVVLQGVDYDAGQVALSAFARLIAEGGPDYPHRLAVLPNAGAPTDIDLDGDGMTRGAGDAEGFGAFAGQGGMAVLSKYPLDMTADLSTLQWSSLPGALLDPADPGADTRRLSSIGHWVVTVSVPDDEPLTLLAFHASPPVFDGPDDLNGRRNHDETALWLHYLDGGLTWTPPAARYVILGVANADPEDGDGLRGAIDALLSDNRLRDVAPRSPVGAALSAKDGGVNATHDGDPELDNANWSDDGPGNLRASYILTSRDLPVANAGILWEKDAVDGTPLLEHGVVWVDLRRPDS